MAPPRGKNPKSGGAGGGGGGGRHGVQGHASFKVKKQHNAARPPLAPAPPRGKNRRSGGGAGAGGRHGVQQHASLKHNKAKHLTAAGRTLARAQSAAPGVPAPTPPPATGAPAPALPPPVLPDDVLLLFFHNPATQRKESLLVYVNSEDAVVLIDVPGDKRRYRKRSEPARRASSALVNWLCDLHILGWSLDGNISISDFGIDHLGYLKGDKRLLPFLQKLEKSSMEKDMFAGAKMIENIHTTVLNHPLPEDLNELLNLLKNFDAKYYDLVCGHISHELEVTKSSIFVKMFSRLMVLKVTNPKLYKKIMNSISCKAWIKSVSMNAHLACALRRIDSLSNASIKQAVMTFLVSNISYHNSVQGLLELRRNAEAHMERDYSIALPGYHEAGLSAARDAFALQPSQNPLNPQFASTISDAISDAIWQSYSNSPKAAEAAAIAAALTTAKSLHPASTTTKLSAKIASRHAAITAAASSAASPAKAPKLMFNAIQVEHMFDVSSPDLLCQFQKAMYDVFEVYQLDTSPKVIRLFR